MADHEFAAFLKRAAAEVATWPAWKQNTLGWWRDEPAQDQTTGSSRGEATSEDGGEEDCKEGRQET